MYMKRIVFNSPDDSMELNGLNNLNSLKSQMIKNFSHFWSEGSGEGDIQIFENNVIKSTLMIEPSIEMKMIYLHCIDNVSGKDFLSVYDKNKLDKVVEICDEIYASEGLFLPLELAWKGIEEYIRTGQLSKEIEWIMPNDVPENGNW